jgi:hypothetical protein
MLTRDTYLWAVFKARCWHVAAALLMVTFLALGMIVAGPRGAPIVQSVATVMPYVSQQHIRDAMLAGGILLAFGIFLSCLILSQSDPRVRCPHCRHPRMNTKLALATEHCETCGRPVPFERPLNVEPEAPRAATSDDPKLPTVYEYRLDLRRYFRYSVFVLFLPTIFFLLASVWLVLGVIMYRREPPPAPRVPVTRVEMWLAIACMASPPLLYAVVALARWRRPSLLTCRRCRRALIARRNEVIASRHCPRCHGRVLRDAV